MSAGTVHALHMGPLTRDAIAREVQQAPCFMACEATAGGLEVTGQHDLTMEFNRGITCPLCITCLVTQHPSAVSLGNDCQKCYPSPNMECDSLSHGLTRIASAMVATVAEAQHRAECPFSMQA
jgi:hypothetical protein